MDTHDPDKPALAPAPFIACLAALALPLLAGASVVGCAAGGPPQEQGYQRKNGNNPDFALAPQPDLGGADLAPAGADLALADLAGSPYDSAMAPQPDMRQAPCTSNCYRIIAVQGEVPAFKADGKDWDSASDNPDPYVRVTLENGTTTARCQKKDNDFFPVWNAVVLENVPFEQLGKNIRFQFLDQDGLFNADDTIVDFTTNFDATDIANGGFTWNIADGSVTLAVQKQ